MGEIIYITCPLCGMNRVLEKKGTSAMIRGLTITSIKGRIHFDHLDLATASIVQIRERERGKEEKKRLKRGGGPGFIFKRGITLLDMKDEPAYNDLIKQIKSTANNILQILS